MKKTKYFATVYRRNKKQQLVEALGGKCQICSYSKCNSALECHHIDPNTKDFGFGKMLATNWSWEKIEKEAVKCILLCANCHRELHDGLTNIPDSYQKFDKSLITSKKAQRPPKVLKGRAFKIDWDSLDWEHLLTTYKTNIAIAELLGVSDSMVSRQKLKRKLVFH